MPTTSNIFTTNTGHPLTPKEAKFIDNYVETGNARQSYILAYGNKSSAAQLANRLLNKDYIKVEIAYRLEKAKTESIASAQEIMEYWTRVMRGEEKDQFNLEVPIGERTRAAQELAKRIIDIPEKVNGSNETPELKITLNWERPTTTSESGNGDDGK